jgi:hypothetical protein
MHGESRGTALDRPARAGEKAFYFIVVLWGERYREYFLQYCLPSLLAPDNIPALAPGRRSRFLIATISDDWRVMAASAIFRRLEQYVEPVYIEIPSCPPGRSGCEHMNIGHKLACDMAWRDQALALVLTPDTMVSNGTVARLQELANAGVHLVVAAALRFAEEPFFAHLGSMGLIPAARGTESAEPLAISGRQMAYAAVNGFHPETLSYEWDGPYLLPVIPAAWWRVPDEDGVVLHCLSWAPLLLDYGAVARHDMSTLDGWTIDGDYLFKNIQDDKNIHVVQDSDEMFLASWAPEDERASVFRPFGLFQHPLGKRLHDLIHGQQFRASFYSRVFDPLKRRMFFLPVRWHARPLNAKWTTIEQHAMTSLCRWVAPPGQRANGRFAHPFTWATRLVVLAIAYRTNIARRLKAALSGDRAAMRRIVWNVQSELCSLLGLTLNRPAPPPPAQDRKERG